MQLTPGDIITDVRPLTSKPGWSEGTLRGERAHFPDSMVELHVSELYNKEVRVFLSQPSEWLYCRSCHQLLVEAQEMSCCEGVFCLKCIEQWKALGKDHCPGCTTTEGWRWHPNRTVERMLKGLHILCCNHSKGCQWKGELRDQNEHLTKDTGCQFAIVQCPHKCETAVMRMSLNDHVTTECQLRPFECQYCQTMSTYTDIINKHLPECPMHPITCPNDCGAEGVVRQGLTEHLNTCPLQSVKCSNDCGVEVLRKHLEGHLEEDCVKRKIPCEYCKAVDTFEEIMGKHLDVCGHVPLDCPNKCSDAKILRQDLPDHIEKSCPLHMVGCEFAHVGCSETFCRKDRADHMAHSQAAHLSSVMTQLVLQEKKYKDLQSSHELLKENYAALECQHEAHQKECKGLLEHQKKMYDELRSSYERLKKKYAALEHQNEAHRMEYQRLLKELKSDFETLKLRSLRARQHELEHASRLPPQPEGLPRVFCMDNCKNVRSWSTGKVRIHGVDLTFNISFDTRMRSREGKTVYVEGNGSDTSSHCSPFRVSFEMLHSEDEVNNVVKAFNVEHTSRGYYSGHPYTVTCSPQRSILIENTADFKWESYMINQSLYFRVTVTK